jgi:hypothetical protein
LGWHPSEARTRVGLNARHRTSWCKKAYPRSGISQCPSRGRKCQHAAGPDCRRTWATRPPSRRLRRDAAKPQLSSRPISAARETASEREETSSLR